MSKKFQKRVPEWKRTVHPLLMDKALMDVVSGDNVMMCRFTIFERTKLPAHSHPHEQLSYVIKGKMRMRVGNAERTLGSGDVQIIPANVDHSAEIIETPFEEIDVFNPVRSEFLD